MEADEQVSRQQQEGRTRRPYGITTACILIIVTCALVLARGTGYRRFVSKPLQDGTRYTFLYPEYLTEISENGKGADPGVTATVNISTSFSKQPGMNRFLSWLRVAPSATSDRISVLVVPHPPGQHVKEARQSLEHGDGRAWWTHAEIIEDERSQTHYVLAYMCDADRHDQYQSHHSQIASSFRVLSPGALIPDP